MRLFGTRMCALTEVVVLVKFRVDMREIKFTLLPEQMLAVGLLY